MNQIQAESMYSERINDLTLGDALQLYYAQNPQFTVWSGYKSERARKLVKAHDVTHLIFGCDTSLLGEMRVQLWTKFGVKSFSLRESFLYAQDKEARVLLKNPVGYWAMFLFFLKHINEIRKIRARAKMMSQKWVYFEEEAYMTSKIGDIRKRFNIVITS
jgi:ubiquinone biosynthesis protein Coq4